MHFFQLPLSTYTYASYVYMIYSFFKLIICNNNCSISQT